ncbi:MAG: hypothetical protein ABI550_04530 [Ignavibacteriaceae bacterium]
MNKYIFIILALFFISCSNNNILFDNSFLQKIKSNNSIIYIIHGDGDYLFHNEEGEELFADEEILKQAKETAEKSYDSEVFIFHFKKKSHSFLFFPDKNAELYFYKKGNLILEENYFRDLSEATFKKESDLVKEYSSLNNENINQQKKVLLYYGHEIPEFNGESYNSSYPEKEFTINEFANGTSLLASSYKKNKFSLIVLSTCGNGTPGVISKLKDYSDFIIASPENLHLSYINSDFISEINNYKNMGDFSLKFAENAFEKLKENTNTIITISLYDTKEVSSFLNQVYNDYDEVLNTIKNSPNYYEAELCDCNSNSIPDNADLNSGVNIFYQPPKFGKEKNKLFHSGWECWKFDKNMSINFR